METNPNTKAEDDKRFWDLLLKYFLAYKPLTRRNELAEKEYKDDGYEL